ncbi:MAG: hypothetical protein D6706_13555, partial [Chloroflexi bacterium]
MKLRHIAYRLRAKFILAEPGTNPLDDPEMLEQIEQRSGAGKIIIPLAVLWIAGVFCWGGTMAARPA